MTDKYAVIGNPIGHTKSPLIHQTFARQSGQDIEYTAIEGRLGGFREDVEAFRQAGGRGMNVTAPFKLDAFAYATDLTEQARLAGAANALKFDGGRIYAHNFDGIGLTRDIVHSLGTPMAGRRVLLLVSGTRRPAGEIRPGRQRYFGQPAWRTAAGAYGRLRARLPGVRISVRQGADTVPVSRAGRRGAASGRRRRHARRTGGGSFRVVARRSAGNDCVDFPIDRSAGLKPVQAGARIAVSFNP